MKTDFSRWARVTAVAATMFGAAQLALAAPVMPSFANAPVGWSVDRHAAASFSDVGTYQGRSDVLGIGIDSSTNASARASGQQGAFYNTQGMKHTISGGAGSVMSADLYIDRAWATPTSSTNGTTGYVRTDMWGTMVDGAATVSAYPIIGFTNYGGAARLRVWDADTPNGWVDLADTILYDAWNSFSVEFTGTSFDYYVNGAFAYSYTDATISGSTQFSEVIMQAYNFNGDVGGTMVSGNRDYSVHWSNAVGAVPEPGSLALVALALLSAGAVRRSVTRKA